MNEWIFGIALLGAIMLSVVLKVPRRIFIRLRMYTSLKTLKANLRTASSEEELERAVQTYMNHVLHYFRCKYDVEDAITEKCAGVYSEATRACHDALERLRSKCPKDADKVPSLDRDVSLPIKITLGQIKYTLERSQKGIEGHLTSYLENLMEVSVQAVRWAHYAGYSSQYPVDDTIWRQAVRRYYSELSTINRDLIDSSALTHEDFKKLASSVCEAMEQKILHDI